MVEPQSSKLATRVRFPSSAPTSQLGSLRRKCEDPEMGHHPGVIVLIALVSLAAGVLDANSLDGSDALNPERLLRGADEPRLP